MSKSSYSWPAMLAGVLSVSSRVVSDHSRHFLALSVLFLLPLSFIIIASPSLLPILMHHHQFLPPQSLLRDAPLSSTSPDFTRTLILASAAAALFLPIASAGAAAVTRSVIDGFYGRPVKILPNLRSLHIPVLHLLATVLSGFLIFSAIVALIVSLCLLLLFILSILDVESGSVPPYSFAAGIAAITIARFQLEWCLAGVVSVMESTWGFAPLKRSGELIDGMRLAAICLWVVFGAGIGFTLWGLGLWEIPSGGSWYDVMPVVGKTVLGSALTSLLLLYIIVTHAALYLYCKAVHGELLGEIVEEFASEYVTLPFDDNRVPHVVSVVLR
ncbi:uncharacterized protein LOC110031289 [Phalaenopsis equestris]|uniref:uncharacterized protein LOC110031289 n=1 Tax=Phalaenopsis equestris TaxID=78828 RepID=UPI0009E27BF6|nr:uncharacterized protein LOC110031289 [Phalaenopsis equestris]